MPPNTNLPPPPFFFFPSSSSSSSCSSFFVLVFFLYFVFFFFLFFLLFFFLFPPPLFYPLSCSQDNNGKFEGMVADVARKDGSVLNTLLAGKTDSAQVVGIVNAMVAGEPCF